MSLFKRKTDPKIEWLGSQPWWEDLDHHQLTTLAATGDRATLPGGHSLMREGQRGHEAAVIVSGEMEISRDGHILARLGPGEVVGELSMLGGRTPRSADVRCATDVELLVFSVESFQQVMHSVKPIREQVLAAAARHQS